jgi:hypothetical protein
MQLVQGVQDIPDGWASPLRPRPLARLLLQLITAQGWGEVLQALVEPAAHVWGKARVILIEPTCILMHLPRSTHVPSPTERIIRRKLKHTWQDMFVHQTRQQYWHDLVLL